jgi:hypothetical protein
VTSEYDCSYACYCGHHYKNTWSNFSTDSILNYLPFWPLVSLWLPKLPQSEKTATKLINIISERKQHAAAKFTKLKKKRKIYRRPSLPQNLYIIKKKSRFSDGLGRRKVQQISKKINKFKAPLLPLSKYSFIHFHFTNLFLSLSYFSHLYFSWLTFYKFTSSFFITNSFLLFI